MPQFMHKTNQHIFSKLTRICVRPEDFISRVIHNDDHQHALKEVDAAASAVAKDQHQVVRILKYIINGNL